MKASVPSEPDQQVGEDLQRLVIVEERAQAVPGGVLDLELVRDALGELAVGAQLVADLGQAGGELGRRRCEPLGCTGCAGVDHRAVGERERQRTQCSVGVGVDAAAHAARVVGEHTAETGDLGAGRIGADPAPLSQQTPIDAAEHGAGLDTHARAAVFDGHVFEVTPAVEQDAVGLRLAVEARAPGPEDERGAGPPGHRHHGGDLADVARHGDGPWNRAVTARVGGVADQIARAARETARREHTAQCGRELGRRALGDPVGRSIGGGPGHRPVARRLGRDPLDTGLSRSHPYSSHMPLAQRTCTRRGPSCASIAAESASISSSVPCTSREGTP